MKSLSLVLLLVLNVSCANRIKKAARDVKYSAYEMVGLEKRDLFKKEVSGVKDQQEESGEALKDALTRLKEVYNFDGGDLEDKYSDMNSAYDSAFTEGESLKQRIAKLDTVAGDLFDEWKQEITQIGSADLRRSSQSKLTETQKNYAALHKQLKKSESTMDPVLKKFKDQVLFLKHNLNAKAITGLKVEGAKIQSDIQALIEQMNRSIKESESFIKTMD
jgi:hypothetical protein